MNNETPTPRTDKVVSDDSREDWIDCQIDEMLRDYNSLPHVVARKETK